MRGTTDNVKIGPRDDAGTSSIGLLGVPMIEVHQQRRCGCVPDIEVIKLLNLEAVDQYPLFLSDKMDEDDPTGRR